MRYLQSVPETHKLKIDLKDKKILSILAENARIPLTQLCKRVALSRDAVDYRIKNYEKEGLIQGYRTIIDISKFNYDNYHLFVKLNNPSKEIEQKIIERLKKLNFIRAILKFTGDYDLEIAMITKGVQDLNDKISIINSILHKVVQDIEILTITKTITSRVFPKNFLTEEKVKEIIPKNKKEYTVDKKDVEILKIISEDALKSLVDISSKVKISADSVTYRIKKMIESKIIIKFVPILNSSSLDLGAYTLLLNVTNLNKEKEDRVKEFLENNKSVHWCAKSIGRFNYIIYLLVKDTEELQQTLVNLRSLFPGEIDKLNLLITHELYKYVYFPEDLF
jgi:Lrp/AsnC family transcriptional regulator for asnA, asnC and gidA